MHGTFSAPENEPPPPWHSREIVAAVQEILSALELIDVDAEVRHALQKICYRRDHFHGDGRGHITLLIRTIVESAGNGVDALIAPVVVAVESAMRPAWTKKGIAWLEAFDRIPLLTLLQAMRSLDLFKESSLGPYLSTAITNKLWKHFGPDVAAAPVKVKAAPKPPARLSRIPVIEKRVQLGLALLDLKAKAGGSTKTFSALRKRHFPDTDPVAAVEAVRIAQAYGQRPEIYRRASWECLFQLSCPSLPAAARRRFEAAIVAGREVTGVQIARARGKVSTSGRPGRQERPAARMAA
jgi:hypothetical protein